VRALLAAVLMLTMGCASRTECRFQAANISQIVVEQTPGLAALHDAGHCGEGLRIGVLAAGKPDGQLEPIEGRLFLPRYHPDSAASPMLTEQIWALHAAAPHAVIDFRSVAPLLWDDPMSPASSISPDPQDALDEAWINFVDTARSLAQQSDIVVNLVISPYFERVDTTAFEQLVVSRSDRARLWLQSAGSYGSSFYHVDTPSLGFIAMRPFDHFFANNRGDDYDMLRVKVIDSARELAVFLVSDDDNQFRPVLYRLVSDTLRQVQPSFAQPDRDRSPIYLSRWSGLSTDETLLLTASSLSVDVFSPQSGFTLYIDNGIFVDGSNPTGGTIPVPNVMSESLTVGALHLDHPFFLPPGRDNTDDKPNIFAYARLNAQSQRMSSGFSTLIAAGSAASLLSAYPDLDGSALLSDLTAGASRNLIIDRAPPLSLEIGTLLMPAAIIVAAFLVIVVIALIRRRRRKYTLFISYKSDDKGFVNGLRESLNRRLSNWCVWQDQADLPRTGKFPKELERAVVACDALLLVMTPAALASEWVQKEYQLAFDEKKLIIPMQYEEVELSTLPRELRDYTVTNYYKDKHNATLDEIVGILKRYRP